MTDLIARLAEIDRIAGREPMADPTKIEGAPLPPPVRELDTSTDIPEPPWATELDEDPDAVPEPESPLIPRQTAREFLRDDWGTQEPPGQPQPPTGLPTPDLLVISSQGQRGASYKGREVVLLESEERAIAKVVLKALGRELREHWKSVATPRARRTKKEGVNASTRKGVQQLIRSDAKQMTEATLGVKRRGRPRKQRLDGSVT